MALKRLDDLEGAEKALEKAHSLGPQEPLVLVNYAVVLDAQRKPGRAREMLVMLSDVTAVIDVDVQVSWYRERESGNSGREMVLCSSKRR